MPAPREIILDGVRYREVVAVASLPPLRLLAYGSAIGFGALLLVAVVVALVSAAAGVTFVWALKLIGPLVLPLLPASW